KRIVCLTCPGDRRDEDARAIARKAAGKFDTYLCHMDEDLRGREPDEIPRIMRDELISLGVDPDCIDIIPEEMESVKQGLRSAGRGDLVLIFCSAVEEAWGEITGHPPTDAEPQEPMSNGVTAKSLTDDIEAFEVPDGFKIVRDERGVRLEPSQ
ncbi:MAG: cyanophycin synthetase, partial [Pseudomonadota bacterium]